MKDKNPVPKLDQIQIMDAIGSIYCVFRVQLIGSYNRSKFIKKPLSKPYILLT